MKKLLIVRHGSCKRCGQCCDKSLSQPDRWAEMRETADPDVRIAKVNGRIVKMPRVCGSLTEEGCAVYEHRAPICRNFPAHPNDLKMIGNCGYHFTLEWREVDGEG